MGRAGVGPPLRETEQAAVVLRSHRVQHGAAGRRGPGGFRGSSGKNWEKNGVVLGWYWMREESSRDICVAGLCTARRPRLGVCAARMYRP